MSEASGGSESGTPQRANARVVVRTGLALVILLAAWWFGVRLFEENRIAARREIVQEEARQYRAALTLAVRSRIALVAGLRGFVERQEAAGGLKRDAFEAFAAGERANSPWIRTIQVAPGGVITWTYPLQGNEAAIGLDLKTHENTETRTDALRALASKGPVLSGPFALAQGGRGLVIRQSVRTRDGVWGLAAVVTDVPALLEEAGFSDPASEMNVVLKDRDGHVVAGDTDALPSDPVTATVKMGDADWGLFVAPKEGWAGWVAGSVGPVRWLGLVLVSLIALQVYVASSRRLRLTQLVEARTHDLGESERRYRTLFEESPVSLWEEDFSAVRTACDALSDEGVGNLRAYLEGDLDELRRIVALTRVTDVNQATVSLYGATHREQLTQGLAAFVTPENAREFIAQIVAVAEGRRSLSLMSRIGPPGAQRHVSVTWNVVPGHADYSAVVVCVVDMTDRVRAEAALESYREDLESLVEERTGELTRVNKELLVAQKAKDAFLASMSHELRTPLNSILGFTGVMLQGAAGPLTEEQERQLGMVHRSGRQLLALVNDVLDLAKLEGGHVAVGNEDVEVASFVGAVMETVRPLADEKGLGLSLIVDAGAPERLTTDRDRVRQVLLNLLGNAIKFTDEGGVRVCVGRVADDPGCLAICVEDTGPGVPDENAEVIFEPFHQLSRDAGAQASGTGLGLAISRDLASVLGGSLRLVRPEGRGSRFELRLPVVPRPLTEESA